VKFSVKLAILVAAVPLGWMPFSQAQQAQKSKNGSPAQTAAPPAIPQADTAPASASPPPGWAARCSSASRDGKPIDLEIQTCENRGCYASTPIAPELLAALKSGKQLKVSFQNLAKETITIPMPLNDFAAAYEKIK
jgi:hypothetical protein